MEKLRKTQAQNTFVLPQFDPNPIGVGTTELLGRLYAPGDFAQIRYADPVVAPLLNFIRKHLEAVVWSVEPVENTYEAIGAADITNAFLRSVEWNEFAALVYDMVHTFGHLYVERVWCKDPNSEIGISAKLTPLFPPTVSRIQTTPCGLRTKILEQTVDVGVQTFQGEELLHYVSNTDVAGNLTGISGLRPLVFPHRASQIDQKVYLDARTRSAGTIVINLMSGLERGSQEFGELQDALDSVVSGESGYLVLPADVEAKMLSNNNPPDGALENWKYYDSIKRAALGHYLENLGLNGTGSNRALGEVLSDADNHRWQAQLAFLEKILTHQGLLPEFYNLVGIPKNLQPVVTIKREDEITDLDEVLRRLGDLVEIKDELDNVEFELLKREILNGRI